MFYQDVFDEKIRFGDILRGQLLLTVPKTTSPLISNNRYTVELEQPDYCVVLSPCCSSNDGIITVSPLVKILSTFYKNPYFEEDFTRLNHVMSAQNAIPPKGWESMEPEVKQSKLQEGETYAFFEYFIFDKHNLLKKYTVDLPKRANEEINIYMIDFRNQYKVLYKPPYIDHNESKLLQLSIETRKALRKKIAFYYSRVPDEDREIDED